MLIPILRTNNQYGRVGRRLQTVSIIFGHSGIYFSVGHALT
jgi:hypothetical protein